MWCLKNSTDIGFRNYEFFHLLENNMSKCFMKSYYFDFLRQYWKVLKEKLWNHSGYSQTWILLNCKSVTFFKLKKQIRSKEPIILYFVTPKRPSCNCYVNCFLTEKTPLFTNVLNRMNFGSNVQFWLIDLFFRLKDDTGTPMLLKLKDWPPSEDFASYMPKRFNDIINTYPLHEYTHR
jgi:hypothetical protein